MEWGKNDSLFSSSILSWVRPDILGANSTSSWCAVTAKGSCTEAVRCREGEFLVPGAGGVHGERRDGQARSGLAMRGYEDCMWMGAMPWRGGRAYAAPFGTSCACRTAVGGGWLRGGWRTRTRAGPSIGGFRAGVVDGVVVCRWWGLSWIVSKG